VLFGTSQPSEPWPVDVLTLEYLVSGTVEETNQKWDWSYFQTYGVDPAVPFDLRVSSVRSTGAYPKPALEGTLAFFVLNSSLVAVIPRGPAADRVWDQWNKTPTGVVSEVLAGPYSVTGTVLSVDSRLTTVILGRALALRDAAITRVDGAGDATPIQAPRLTLFTHAIHSALERI
jgi:hypothetical protein